MSGAALFPHAAPATLTVTQLNQRARLLLENSFARVAVGGEVSNLRVVSGHHYFTLKDDASQLAAVMFRREASAARVRLRDGMEVVATGRITIYAARGTYQIVVDRVEPRGVGALQAAFEQLKARLAAEGLFDPARKRGLPLLPRRVAVVTSPTGAVIRDIVQVGTRRFPGARIVVVPTRVQGEECGEEIARAVELAGAHADRLGVEVIVVARGGGSLEDLWGFNEERVARAVAAAPVPVVSAVGHETDFTICDFVADRRAPTPSAAAEIVFPAKSDLLARLHEPMAGAGRVLDRELQQRRYRLRAARAGLGDVRGLTSVHTQRVDHARVALQRAMQRQLGGRRQRLHELESTLAGLHPRVTLREMSAEVRGLDARCRLLIEQRLGVARGRLEEARRRVVVDARISGARERLLALRQRLEALSPLGVLQRGYGIVLGPDGRALTDAGAVAPGVPVDIRLARGRLDARVEGVHPAEQGADDVPAADAGTR